MFQVQPVRSREAQAALAGLVGCPYFEDTYAFSAVDLTDDASAVTAVIGLCQFTYAPEEAVIRSIKAAPGSEDDEAMIVMLRAVTAFLNRAEIPFVYAEEGSADPAFLTKLGFRPLAGGRLGIDLAKFYRSPHQYMKDEGNG